MGAAHQHRLVLDVMRIDVALLAALSAQFSRIEDERRKGFFVANAEQHERGQADRVGLNAGDVDALAGALLADEPAHMLVADAGDKAASQAQPRGADGDISRAAANRLGESRHIFQAAADLHAVEVDPRAADRDHIQAGIKRHGGLAQASSGGSLVPTTFWSKSMSTRSSARDLSEQR